MKEQFIYHFTPKTLWNTGKTANNYLPEAFPEEGFIHCSTFSQILGSANKHADKTKQHVLLKINPEKLTSELLYEYTKTGAGPFPHIFGVLNNEAVIEEFDFPVQSDGSFKIPF